jgi:hypothetical protein
LGLLGGLEGLLDRPFSGSICLAVALACWLWVLAGLLLLALLWLTLAGFLGWLGWAFD